MRANEFVKKFGWNYTIGFYNWVNENKRIDAHSDFKITIDNMDELSYSQLKRLVESWELVEDLYGLERAKQYADSPYTAPEVSEAVKQAIKDVESCQ